MCQEPAAGRTLQLGLAGRTSPSLLVCLKRVTSGLPCSHGKQLSNSRFREERAASSNWTKRFRRAKAAAPHPRCPAMRGESTRNTSLDKSYLAQVSSTSSKTSRNAPFSSAFSTQTTIFFFFLNHATFTALKPNQDESKQLRAVRRNSQLLMRGQGWHLFLLICVIRGEKWQLFQLFLCKPESCKQRPAWSTRARDVLLILVAFFSSLHNPCPTSQELKEPVQKKEANLGKDRSARLTNPTKCLSLCNY